MVTSYPCTMMNWNIKDGNYFPINLRKSPFKLPKPLMTVVETAPRNEMDKTMFLYRLEDLK